MEGHYNDMRGKVAVTKRWEVHPPPHILSLLDSPLTYSFPARLHRVASHTALKRHSLHTCNSIS